MDRTGIAMRARTALAAGRGAAALSQVLGRGSGTIIAGRLAMQVDPGVLGAVARGRRSVLVTGTNGKSTVTALVAAALGGPGAVVTNATGANMPDGIVTTLAGDRASRMAALEVDEVYLRTVVESTGPQALVVLNAFREYTRGVSLAATLTHWRQVAAGLSPGTSVLVNADDPLSVWAFEGAARLVPVAGGLHWRDDAALCPACGAPHTWDDAGWHCTGCRRARPEPAWFVAGGDSASGWQVAHPGGTVTLRVTVPGRTGPIGGAFALAAADAMGVELGAAAGRIAAVTDVDGRYVPFPVGGRRARLLMLKNPAGWAEAIDLAASTQVPLVLAVDPFGPKDTTTMWEAPFGRLAGRRITITGGRSADVAALLDAWRVPHDEVPDALAAIGAQPEGEVLVACNYPAFRRLSRQLRTVAP